MILFIIFILAAVIIGTGALLAPAWPTNHPRIGLAAALALGVVIGGAIFLSSLSGWNTLNIDYLLFALVTTIFLGGTLTFGQKRAEERGIAVEEFQEGWPGPRDLALFALIALIFIAPTLILPVPADTDAQGFGYLALMARLGGSFTTLAPWHPEIHVLYSPGFATLAAYLSHQLGQPLQQVQFAIGAVLGVLLIWLAYDFGTELQDKRLGRAMALAMFGGAALYLAYLDSHYTALLGLVFALAFLTYALRYLRHGILGDAVAAGLMLGAVVLSQPDATIILGLGYAPWLLTMWVGQPRPTVRRWLVLLLGIPLLAVLALAPWLASVRDLLGSNVVSPFERDPGYWRVMLIYHGVWIVPVALIGAVVGLRRRNQAALLAVVWLLLILDFSTTGLLPRLLPGLLAPILRYDYPFSLAWHGPIIPYSILGGIGLLWLWDRLAERRIGAALHRHAFALIGAGAVITLAAILFSGPLLALTRGHVQMYGAFSSQADVQAMTWLRENTAQDARVLNYPAPHEGDWVPVIAERDSIYFRPQPFFRGDHIPTVDQPSAEQTALLAFWHNPADSANAALLRSARISYVIVPQMVANPDSLAQQFRWHEPFTVEMQSPVSAAPYLELVFDADGAQVYRVR